MRLSIVIPVFNEEKTIAKIIHATERLKIPNVVKEIIVINDASTDKTQSEINKAVKKYKNIYTTSHKKNLGKGAAVQTGLQRAKGDYIVIQDADLEYNPQDIKKLLIALENRKAEVAFGTRLNRLPHITQEERRASFLLQYIGNRFLSLATSILYGQWITDMETCYKLIPKSAMQEIKLQSKGFEFEPEITAKLMKKGFRITEVPISTTPRGREEGKKLNAFIDGPRALWAIIKYRFYN